MSREEENQEGTGSEAQTKRREVPEDESKSEPQPGRAATFSQLVWGGKKKERSRRLFWFVIQSKLYKKKKKKQVLLLYVIYIICLCLWGF